MNIFQKTTVPETFFSRYRTAIEEAEVVIRLCNGNESAKSAEKILMELEGNKVRYFNDFLDRCDSVGKLPFVKNKGTQIVLIINAFLI